MMSPKRKKLPEILSSLPPGEVTETAELAEQLARCWSELHGSAAEGTTGGKLIGRMEHVVWDPPLLRFELERHGATMYGSTRADLHHSVVDAKEGTALIVQYGRRQLEETSPRLDVKPFAELVAKLIAESQDDERLKWTVDRQQVVIRIGKVIPKSRFQQTTGGRRRRFRKALAERIGPLGWRSRDGRRASGDLIAHVVP